MRHKEPLLIWMFSGVISLLVFILLFSHSFPMASIDIRLDKEQILEKAVLYVQEQGFDLQGFDRTILFDSDFYTSVYLQKTQGMKKSNQLIKTGLPVWFWSIRWFRELDKEGFYCTVDPANGQILSFEHFLLDDAAGKDLQPKQAKTMAEEKIIRLGIDTSEYELKENSIRKQKNRTDYHFVWEKKNYAVEQAHLRLAVSIYGDTLGYIDTYLDIPEKFIRGLQKEVSFGQVLSIITMIFMFLLFIAVIIVIIIQFKKDKVNWKFGLVFGIIVTILTLADFFNSLPLLWSTYPDTTSKGVFITISAASALIGALLVGLMIFLFGSAGESLSSELWKSKLPLFEISKFKKISVKATFSPFVVGYSLGFLFLGYITLFYLVGTKFFNIWMPPEAEYSNILGTSMPFLFPLTIAISAAVSEEFIFRLFSISLFKKYLKQTWCAVLIPAVIWAFAHSNYPVFPAYVRGIELTIAGIVFGIVFLKYGLETVLIAHFVIDAALVGLPLLKSHNAYFVISGMIVIALAFIPAVILIAIAFKQNKRGNNNCGLGQNCAK